MGAGAEGEGASTIGEDMGFVTDGSGGGSKSSSWFTGSCILYYRRIQTEGDNYLPTHDTTYMMQRSSFRRVQYHRHFVLPDRSLQAVKSDLWLSGTREYPPEAPQAPSQTAAL